jgi:hypothetical protein
MSGAIGDRMLPSIGLCHLRFVTQSYIYKHCKAGREGSITYKCTSHSSHINGWWPTTGLWVFEANSGVK